MAKVTSPESAGPDLAPGGHLKKPQQRRSEATLRRMLAAAEALLDEGTFEEATVGEIVRRAKTSVGSFYSRFADKAALLQVLEDGCIEALLQQFAAFYETKRLSQASLEEVIRALITEIASLYRDRRGLMRALAVKARSRRDPDLEDRAGRANEALYAWALDLIQRQVTAIRHPEPELAIPMGMSMVAAALREHILFRDARLSPAPVDDQRLIEELTRAFVAYLGVGDDPLRSRSAIHGD
jgi:AcrR family transcriptional regulator